MSRYCEALPQPLRWTVQWVIFGLWMSQSRREPCRFVPMTRCREPTNCIFPATT